MDILIKNCDIINGDAKTFIEKSNIFISGNKITEIAQSEISSFGKNVIDGKGLLAIPGIINSHTHGCSLSPLFSSGSPPLDFIKAKRNATRHLTEGVTSLINVCGMGTFEENTCLINVHPLKIYFTTAQVHSTFEAAKIVDAKGLRQEHYDISAKEMIGKGASAVGEIGSGATLGGGVSEYKLIPEAIEKEIGLLLSFEQIQQIKKTIFNSDYSFNESDDELKLLMSEFKIISSISTNRIKDIFYSFIIKPVKSALQSFEEAYLIAEENNLPIIFHNSDVSAQKIYEIAKNRKNKSIKMIAAHSNHSSLSEQNALFWATKLKEEGVFIDIATINSVLGNNYSSLKNIESLLYNNLVDIITTDYMGGAWESALTLIQYLTSRKKIDLLKAVNMATGKVAQIFDNVFGDRGILEAGKCADIVLVDKRNVSQIETIIIDGEIVYNFGEFLIKKEKTK